MARIMVTTGSVASDAGVSRNKASVPLDERVEPVHPSQDQAARRSSSGSRGRSPTPTMSSTRRKRLTPPRRQRPRARRPAALPAGTCAAGIRARPRCRLRACARSSSVMEDARARLPGAWASTASCTRSWGTRIRRSSATSPRPGARTRGQRGDPRAVAAFAREREIDIAMVSADEPLAAGVVDALLAQGTSAVGPTRAGAEIEWNKVFARELLAEVAPDAVPALRVVRAAAGRWRDGVLRLDAGGGEARRADRRQGREGDGTAPGRPRRGGAVRAQPARARAGA